MKPSNESSDVLHLQGSAALECSTLLLQSLIVLTAHRAHVCLTRVGFRNGAIFEKAVVI